MIPIDIEQEIAAYMTRLAAIMTRESDVCPSCLAPVEKLVERGRCVYALPCYHRIYQGELPEAWREAPPEEREELE